MTSDPRWRWVELIAAVVWPTVMLTFGGRYLSPPAVLVAGLTPPVVLAAAGVVREGRPSVLSVIALVSVLVTGGIGLLQLDARWFALKEMLVPTVIGALLIASARTPYAVMGAVFGQLFDPDRLATALAATGQRDRYDRAIARGTANMGAITAGSGPVSAAFALWMIHSPSGTEAFTAELGAYTGWSFVLVNLPVLALTVWALRGALIEVEAATGRSLEDLTRAAASPSTPPT